MNNKENTKAPPYSWWRHQMETFSALLAICARNSPVPGEFPTQMPVTRSFDVFFDLWINGWVNNGEAGDLIRYRTHYDVTVMIDPASNVESVSMPSWTDGRLHNSLHNLTENRLD